MMGFSIDILPPVPGKKTKFGAKVTGLDVNNISDEDLQKLKEATWTYKLLIIKGQGQLKPIKQWELVTRLDPSAPEASPELFMKDFHPEGEGLLKQIGVTGIPGAENVHLIGKGFQGNDHYGIKNKNINSAFSNDSHFVKLSEDDFNRGFTRFQGWHFDAPLYSRDPAWFTAFRVIKLPKGPDVTIRWDDGTGLTMAAPPGITPFFCCSQLYEECLSKEEKIMADNSWVEYQALPYEWNRYCRTLPNGLGTVSEGRELALCELEAIGPDQSKVKKYPMVWVNPHTGRKSFQVQANAARRLYIRRHPNDKPIVIDDISAVRAFLLDIQRRILKPEYILAPPEEEGDLLLWDNCSTMHTRVDYPIKYGPKTCHQAGTNASGGPVGPVPIPAGWA